MRFMLCLLFAVYWEEGKASCDTADVEPCFFKNYKELPYTSTRHPTIGYSSATDDTKFCDLHALNRDQWYRSSYYMTNHCVDHRKCGTSDPIYLSGHTPSAAEGVVDGTACVRTFYNCCEHTLNLRMKNCVNFMIYCFLDLHPVCHSRFCIDSDLIEETNTSTKTTATKTTAFTTCTTTTSSPTTRDKNESQDRDRENKNGIEWLLPVLISGIITCIILLVAIILCVKFCRRQKSLDNEQSLASKKVGDTFQLTRKLNGLTSAPKGYEDLAFPPNREPSTYVNLSVTRN